MTKTEDAVMRTGRNLKGDSRDFRFLMEKIKSNTNIDFSHYRQPVLLRRIAHRLHQTGCADYWDYIMLLNKSPEEYDRLVETLTIKVSEFFRDPNGFEVLRDTIIPEIVARKQVRGLKRIRAWSCGAAYGQEAYSTAILFCEALGTRLNSFDVRILATDIDRVALEKARWGSYDRSAMGNISPHLLFNYFSLLGDNYVVADSARSLVTFRYHDVISGPAISGMDLVICKNLFIYFEKELKEGILSRLHAALNVGGFLVLGKTETIVPEMLKHFEVVNPGERIYKKT